MQKYRVDLGYALMVLAVAITIMFLWPGLLQNLLVANGFMSHGHCYLWKPQLVLLHLTSDTLIGLAYVSISTTLAYLVYKSRQDIPFHWMFLGFGTFIVACAATHFMEVWTLWTPTYWLSGEFKLITAVASVTTAVMLPPLVPKALSLIETAKISEDRKLHLETANQELEALYERLKELDDLKTQFFANVSHELRTPLALILGPTQKWLASSVLSEEQRHDLEVIDRNARTLLKHVNDLLDVSKLAVGKMEMNYAAVDLVQVVRLTASHFNVLAQERQISFSVETPQSLPAEVDAEKLQRICFNLLSNAFKFTPKSGSIRCIVSSAESATITFQDSGPGVPPSLRNVIFEPFRQGEESITRRFEGTGLGLAIVKEFVELHGGTVSVGEASEGGAIFTVALPIVAPPGSKVRTDYADESDVTQEKSSELLEFSSQWTATPFFNSKLKTLSSKLSPQNSPLVLVVEDNPEMNCFISEMLATEYRIATAFNGQEGLEKAIALCPDLILSDVMMPQVSGDQLVREVRKQPELDATPIIVLSAKTDDALRVQMLREGAQDYLTKPFSTEELRSRIGNLIAMKRVRNVLQQELDSKSQDLAGLAKELATRNRQLQYLASELEIRVEKRTAEVQAVNELLKEEIAERQQAEEDLQKEQEFLKAVLDNVEAAIVACDANGVLTIFNRVAREFHGLPAKPLPAEEWAKNYDLYFPDGKTLMKKEDIPLWRTLQGESIYNEEMMLIPKQGSARLLLASGQPMVNPQGRTLGAVVVMHDITERKQVEEERAQLIREQIARAEAEASKWRFAFLAEARMELSSSLDYETTLSGVAHLAVPILADYCIIDLLEKNGSMRRVETAHIDPAKLELMHEIQRRYPPELKAEAGTAKVLRTGQSELTEDVFDWQIEAFARDSEHLQLLRQLAPVSCIIVPLKTGGQTLGVITLVSAESGRHYDPTDLALAEDLAHSIALAIENAQLYREAQEANRMKDEFLAILSHELRTPLNSMLGWIQLLRTRKFDEAKTARALETIERNARSQTQMIEELLDVSRIIRGKLEMNIREVDLISVIEAALDALRPTAEAKTIDLRFSIVDLSCQTLKRVESEEQSNYQKSQVPNPKFFVSGDANRLQQIVWNLVSNAIKFTPTMGRVEIRLNCVDDRVYIQVRDTGNGINPDFLPYVFERFRQENSSTTRSHGGLGLGLAIVRHLVELHGGKVSAESAGEGQGATFTVQLPLIKETKTPGEQEIRSAVTSSDLSGLRVLVVDDEADAREVLTTLLEECGAEVTAVDSVQQALVALNKRHPDVLVSDIGMPIEDGYSLIRQLRQQETKSGKYLPAVALTAYAREEDRQRVLAAGFQMHVSKPVESDNLTKAIANLVKRSI